jgi:hypothetical protein
MLVKVCCVKVKAVYLLGMIFPGSQAYLPEKSVTKSDLSWR